MDINSFSLVAFAAALTVLALAAYAWVQSRRVPPPSPDAPNAIVAGMREGIILVDAGGLVTHVNPAAAEMLSTDPAQAVGRVAREVFAELFELAERLSEGSEGELSIGTGAAQRLFEVSRGAESGGGSGRLIVLREVTDARRADLSLLLAREEALAAARSKADFLATMSHEIRTPMNGVVGATEILLGTRLDSDQRDLANTIRSSADALLAIIDGVLDFSRIEAGRLELEQVSFSVEEMIEDVVGLFGARAHHQGIDLISSCDTLPAALRGDAGRLRQVLTNLLSNALKFTEKGSVTVACVRAHRDDSSVWIRLSVSDTGIGIDAEQQQHLFEPFMQADTSMTRRYGGTGLGLAICKRLVEMMGGEIALRSQLGRGSTLTVTLPLEAIATTSASPPARPSLRLQAVMLLDVGAATRRSLEAHLKSWGAAVEPVAQAAQAIAILRVAARQGRRFGWLIADLGGEETIRVLRTVRAESPLRQMHLILLYDTAQAQQVDQLRQQGLVDAALVKPLRESQLRECIASLTAPVAGAEAVPTARASRPPPVTLPMPEPARVADLELAANARAARVAAAEMRPLADPPPPAAEGAGDSAAAEARPLPDPAPLARILLVEDNRVNQKVALRMLANLGHAADVAENGRAAVDAFAARSYDLVFMDCQMPVMDGFDATREIRRRECDGVHVGIVAMTANAMDGDRERCLDAGMDDYLAKPVRHEALNAVLERWLA